MKKDNKTQQNKNIDTDNQRIGKQEISIMKKTTCLSASGGRLKTTKLIVPRRRGVALRPLQADESNTPTMKNTTKHNKMRMTKYYTNDV